MIGISLTNTPVGYQDGKAYDLQIAQSPDISGSAKAQFTINRGAVSVSILSQGFLYTSAPAVTAQGPDAPQGVLRGATLTTAGFGYSDSVFQCDVVAPPAGGRSALVQFVNSATGALFQILDGGEGYTSAPVITVVTANGNYIKSITITCAGSYYTPETAVFTINDASGEGAVVSATRVLSGKINTIKVLDGGYGYSNSPTIQFLPPIAPVPEEIPINMVDNNFLITTASASAILSSSDSAIIKMEVYETDGTNEQVISQADMTLRKRVLE